MEIMAEKVVSEERQFMDALVSIIVPVYNAEQFLDRCINSILNQTYQKIELILVDDGSKDRSAEICTAWMSKDERVSYYYQKNAGVSTARNNGIENAHGEYIFFADADDYLNTTCIQHMTTTQERYAADIVVSNAIDVYDADRIKSYNSGSENILLKRDEALYHFLREDLFTAVCWGRLYKKSCVESIRFDTTMRIAEDSKFFYDAIQNSKRICVIPERLYFYCIHQGSVVHSGFTPKYYDELRFCEAIVQNENKNRSLAMPAKLKLFYFCMRLLGMGDLPAEDYIAIRAKIQYCYNEVKSEISTKSKIKFYVYSIPLLRYISLKVKSC